MESLDDENKGVLVAACGTTEFGNFVSLGYIHKPKVDSEVELVLARRYIAETDSRQEIVRQKAPQSLLQSAERKALDRFSLAFWKDLLPLRE
mmetsp:Transcript_45801/g.53605  ORF Transcript_45801/g.53605 Transcript_45801/m.53605 type:complete len:92 (-) Transcript_45801:176-451(-)